MSPFTMTHSGFILNDVKSHNKTRDHYFCGPPANSAHKTEVVFFMEVSLLEDAQTGAGKLKGSFSSPLTDLIRAAKIMAAARDPRLSPGCSLVQPCLQELPIPPR